MTADALRREADRLESESKARKWGLLDANHELTDDGSIGRFVALEPDQLRFAAILAEREAERDLAAACGGDLAPPLCCCKRGLMCGACGCGDHWQCPDRDDQDDEYESGDDEEDDRD